MTEIKVTECWVATQLSDGSPYPDTVRSDVQRGTDRPAILMWKEDYEQLKAKAEAAEFVEGVNRALTKAKDVYFAKLQELLTEKEMSRLIDEAHDDEEAK